MLTEHRGKAMGTTVHIAAVGVTADDVAGVFGRIADRSRRWTRFSPDSELATLNRANGLPCVLSSDTSQAQSMGGNRRTFDPSIHDAMIAAGYDRTFAEGPGPGGPAISAPGLHDLQIDVASATVLAPSNLRLDFGGIGKGFAADLAVSELLDAGAHHAAVSIGGDLRAAGHPEAGWPLQPADRRRLRTATVERATSPTFLIRLRADPPTARSAMSRLPRRPRPSPKFRPRRPWSQVGLPRSMHSRPPNSMVSS